MDRIIKAFEKYPHMAATLRTTVYRNGYCPGVALCIPGEWGMRAIDKAAMVDEMRRLGLVPWGKWELTQAGLTLACRLTS